MGEKNITDVDEQSDQQLSAEIIPDEENKEVSVEEHEIQQDETDTKSTSVDPSTSIKAQTHSKRRSAQPHTRQTKIKKVNLYTRYLPVVGGTLAIVAIVAAGSLGQFYKGKVMPNVIVAGENVGRVSEQELQKLLEKKQEAFKVDLKIGEKKLTPNLKELGYVYDQKATLKKALEAKRDAGILARLQFWKSYEVPAVISVNNNLLAQYVEANFPEIVAQPTDATLSFSAKTNEFTVTPQASGKGADLLKLKAELAINAGIMQPTTIEVKATEKGPNISEKELQPLVEQANGYVKRRIVLSGLGYNFAARPVDIATWLTPTPQPDGRVALIVDPAKVQSYVEGISKRIANAPQDKKVIVDKISGQEVTIQEGRDGTELADKQALANAIASSVEDGKDITQPMNIQVAAYKTVNMDAYEKWIEVDLSEQRTTAYERATPIKSFIIASGTRGYETVKGEFAIWLRVRSQTMQGGSRADGDYYSIPNVEWVSYFYKDYALHGAWWREKFGAPASHGCVNMRNEDAKWVYEWAPLGTKVIVHD